MDIGQRFAELQESGTPADEAVRQIFREDYNANIKQLTEATGLDGAHIGRLKGQVSRTHGKGVTTPSTVETSEMTPPIVIEFKAAIDDLLEKSSPRFKEHLALLFQRQSDKLINSREAFENFLLRNGLTPVQANGVMERIMVTTGQQPPGQGYQTIPLPGGGAIILQTSQPQPQGGQPIVLGGGQGQPSGETAEQARQQARMESRMDRLEEKLGPLSGGGGGGGEPPMRRGRRPLFDEEGNIRADTAGNIVYEDYEEPWEPGAKDTITETLLPLLIKQMMGGGQKPIDEETLVLKVKEKLAPGGEGKVTTEAIKEAVRTEMSGVRQDVETMKQEQARREREEEIDRAVEKTTGEYKTIIQGLSAELGERGGFKGMTDSQIQMKYQKDLIDTMVDAFERQTSSVREDIRPFILQQAVQSMKSQGMSDDVIGQFLNSVRQRIPATGIIPESSKEEAVERVKKWAKT